MKVQIIIDTQGTNTQPELLCDLVEAIKESSFSEMNRPHIQWSTDIANIEIKTIEE